MSALSTLELNFLGKRLFHENYLGTFARDELPQLKKLRRPFGLIFNSDPAGSPGTHWLAIYAAEPSLDFFDSYGFSPSFYGLDYEFRSTNRSVQSVGSAVCGHYCLLFLYYRFHRYSFDSTITSIHLKYSDASAARMISNLTRYSHHRCKGQICSIKGCESYFAQRNEWRQ